MGKNFPARLTLTAPRRRVGATSERKSGTAWLANPIATPMSSLPAMSMPRFAAPAASPIPRQNSAPERRSENLLPALLVVAPATKSVVRAAARKAEEVKSVRRWES